MRVGLRCVACGSLISPLLHSAFPPRDSPVCRTTTPWYGPKYDGAASSDHGPSSSLYKPAHGFSSNCQQSIAINQSINAYLPWGAMYTHTRDDLAFLVYIDGTIWTAAGGGGGDGRGGIDDRGLASPAEHYYLLRILIVLGALLARLITEQLLL